VNAMPGRSPVPREGVGGPPPYASATTALRLALPALSPPRRIQPSRAAELYRIVGTMGARQPWLNQTVPYMVEPMDVSASRRFQSLAFAGPARSGKTDGVGLNLILHRAVCMPRNVLVVHINRDSARSFSREKLDPMIRACPELAARLQSDRAGGDNIFDKTFAGGMRLTVGWPVIGQLSARDIPDVIFSDYDRMPEDIDGEGDPFRLGKKRTQTFGTLGMTIAESSPGRPITDEDWKPDPATPHRPPPTTGILALYDEGTRARWYWRCRHCGDEFEPSFERLNYPRHGTPLERGVAAVMLCPHCGGVHLPSEKYDLNLAGRWLHEATDGHPVPIDGPVRATEMASYWLQGPAAAFQTWRDLVASYESALAVFEATGNEEPLKTTVNVDQGRPHRPSSLGAGGDLAASTLRAGALRLPLSLAPVWTRFLTVAVDTQDSRWVAQVDAWGEGLERCLIDRFDVTRPPDGSPAGAERSVQPPRYIEDWSALDALLDRTYPVEGGGFRIGVAAMIVDSGGSPGVTERAYAWYRVMLSKAPRRVFLAKGLSGLHRARAAEVVPEKILQKKGARARGLRLVEIGTDRLKDEIVASLVRGTPGPGAYHLPEGLADHVFEEFCAERRGPKGWEAKPGIRRNEALDCAVYGKGLAIALKAETIDWRAPPAWAAPLAANAFAVVVEPAPLESDAGPERTHAVAVAHRGRRVRSAGV
jgi:phage terminase large subunit GpA-like protein